jgi:hypothetical protein
MRETITFPRPYHRPLTSVLFVALVGALLLVLALPVSIHAGSQGVELPSVAARSATRIAAERAATKGSPP